MGDESEPGTNGDAERVFVIRGYSKMLLVTSQPPFSSPPRPHPTNSPCLPIGWLRRGPVLRRWLRPFFHGFPQRIQEQITGLRQPSANHYNLRIKQAD